MVVSDPKPQLADPLLVVAGQCEAIARDKVSSPLPPQVAPAICFNRLRTHDRSQRRRSGVCRPLFLLLQEPSIQQPPMPDSTTKPCGKRWATDPTAREVFARSSTLWMSA